MAAALVNGNNNGDNYDDIGCITHLIDNGSVESHRYYLARKTVFEMLSDRGYAVPTSELTRSLAEFRSEFGHDPDPQSLRIAVPLRGNPSSKILVIFCGREDLRKGNMLSTFSQITNRESLHRIILVLQGKMNYHARKVMEEFPIKTETFQITDLLVNITKHVLTPKHEILTNEEKERLLQKHEVKDHQIPRMQKNDAIARYYGLEEGQVIKISYNAGLANSLVTYRCVKG